MTQGIGVASRSRGPPTGDSQQANRDSALRPQEANSASNLDEQAQDSPPEPPEDHGPGDALMSVGGGPAWAFDLPNWKK